VPGAAPTIPQRPGWTGASQTFYGLALAALATAGAALLLHFARSRRRKAS
jgi:hypothetical protein